jgi:ABC-2 type transport system ATP-binding protein
MEEAERYADEIAVIDKGKIVIKGDASYLKKETGTETLEKAFLKLTGYDIRDENVSSLDRMRNRQKKWKK